MTGRSGDVFDRAHDDLQAGRTALARTRLKNYLTNVPRSTPARALLAHAYRLDGHLDEAGRWGYLSPTASTPEERAAYEHSCQHRQGQHRTATATLRGLHWSTDSAGGDPYADDVLADLDQRAAAERQRNTRVAAPWRHRLLAHLRRQRAAPPVPPTRASGPLPDMDRALAGDEHLARIVDALSAHRQTLTTGTTGPEQLLAALRTAAGATDHAHPQWKHLLEHLAMDLDAGLHPRTTTPEHDAVDVALHTLEQLNRAATGRGTPSDRTSAHSPQPGPSRTRPE